MTVPQHTNRRYTATRGPAVHRTVSDSIGAGLVLGAVASVGLIVSMFLSWRTGSVEPSDIPAAFLSDRSATSNPSLMIFLIPLAVVLVVGTVMPTGALARLFAGIGVLVVVGLFAY